MLQLFKTTVSLALLAASIEAFPKSSSRVFDCAVNNLRELDWLNKKVTYTPEIPDDVDCSIVLSVWGNQKYEALRSKVEEDDEYSEYADCIMSKVREFHANVNFQRLFVYENDKTMSALHRQYLITAASFGLESKIDLAEQYCAPDKRFGEFFDSIYEENYSNSTNEDEDIGDLKEDYCHRKIMIEKEFIVNKNIKVNPSNIDIPANFDCDYYWNSGIYDYTYALRDSFTAAFFHSSRKITRCITDIIHASHYSELLLRIWMLNEVRISEERRLSERAQAIKFMKQLYANVWKCRVDESD